MKTKVNYRKFLVWWPVLIIAAFICQWFDGVGGVLGLALCGFYGFVAGYLATEWSREPVPVVAGQKNGR